MPSPTLISGSQCPCLHLKSHRIVWCCLCFGPPVEAFYHYFGLLLVYEKRACWLVLGLRHHQGHRRNPRWPCHYCQYSNQKLKTASPCRSCHRMKWPATNYPCVYSVPVLFCWSHQCYLPTHPESRRHQNHLSYLAAKLPQLFNWDPEQ